MYYKNNLKGCNIRKSNLQKQEYKEHYKKNYDSFERFISYSYQVKLVTELGADKILEIGKGSGFFSWYLKNNGFDIQTCDFDSELEPDHVGDVRNMPLSDNLYDVVVAFQVLEHLPWEEFEKALIEIKRVAAKNVILSLPQASYNFECLLRFAFIKKLFRREYINIFFRVPKFYKEWKFNGKHYWEIGAKGYSKRRIIKILKKHFKLIKQVRPMMNPYHHFFVLEKIDS